MEAIFGAVAMDSNWNWRILEDLIDRLLCLQLTKPDRFLKKTYFELLNNWHHKHFGQAPKYEVFQLTSSNRPGTFYSCALRYFVPENEDGIPTAQRIDVSAETRSAAREQAAFDAYRFLLNHGLWIRLSDANIEPKFEDAINQLQELSQKGYVEAPTYEFEEMGEDEFCCTCLCGGVDGSGRSIGKTKAKKKAAFTVLVRLMQSAGICKDEWVEEMWRLRTE